MSEVVWHDRADRYQPLAIPSVSRERVREQVAFGMGIRCWRASWRFHTGCRVCAALPTILQLWAKGRELKEVRALTEEAGYPLTATMVNHAIRGAGSHGNEITRELYQWCLRERRAVLMRKRPARPVRLARPKPVVAGEAAKQLAAALAIDIRDVGTVRIIENALVAYAEGTR